MMLVLLWTHLDSKIRIFMLWQCLGILFCLSTQCTGSSFQFEAPLPTASVPPPAVTGAAAAAGAGAAHRGAARQMYGSGSLRAPGTKPVFGLPRNATTGPGGIGLGIGADGFRHRDGGMGMGTDKATNHHRHQQQTYSPQQIQQRPGGSMIMQPYGRRYHPDVVYSPYHPQIPIPVIGGYQPNPIYGMYNATTGHMIMIPSVVGMPPGQARIINSPRRGGSYGGRIEYYDGRPLPRMPESFGGPYPYETGVMLNSPVWGRRGMAPRRRRVKNGGVKIKGNNKQQPSLVVDDEDDEVIGGGVRDMGGEDFDHECGIDCETTEFMCVRSCRCINRQLRCDGRTDCEGQEDELQCAEEEIESHETRCDKDDPNYVRCPRSNKCISKSWLCDGDDDCEDYSDETNCGPRVNCSNEQFECQNGLCVPLTWRCDNDNDCKDFSDEINCTKIGCTMDEFMCGDGTCISVGWKCDRQPDCKDGSDEINCDIEPPLCGKDEFRCTYKKCIKKDFKCDGDDDCGDWSDEDDCQRNQETCEAGEFRCNNGKCIPEIWRCDKHNDCEGNEDEKNCSEKTNQTCSPEEYVCSNGACILRTWVCDGENDCTNGEDESKCEITCDDYKFACKGYGLSENETSECINKKHVCDGQRDCVSGNDEFNCPTPRDCEPDSKCTQLCITTSDNTSACACNLGFKLGNDKVTCEDINECLYESDPVCSQTCNNTIGSFVCGCMTGYILRPDLRSCKAIGASPTLLFANRMDIRQVSLSSSKYTAILKNLHNVIALDYHYTKNWIFWSDVSSDIIRRAYINGSGVTDVIKWGLESPSGLAIDWVHNLLFWTDSGTRRVGVSTLDGSHMSIIVAHDLDKPRAIVAHPGEAAVFWTDWGPYPKIERADMDGSNRRNVVTESVFWPNGLTIDYTGDRLYWADAKHNVIETAKFDGGERRKVITKGLPHPFALTIFEDAIYWTDWHTKAISTANKITGTGFRTIHSNLHFPMDIHSYHPQRQPVYNNRCGKNNGGCTHLCLPNAKSYSCQCRMGMKLKIDGKSCQKPDKLLVFTRKKDIRIKHLDYNAQRNHDIVIPIDGVKSAIALAWDSDTESIFWTDIDKDTINKAHWNGSNQQVILHNNIITPAGLDYDWLTKKLYWTDDGRLKIEVASTDGSMRSLLIWENLSRPRDIVVDPINGYMYWSDWGLKPKIERAALDGSMRSEIINSNTTWPNGLAIDYSSGKLCWADGGTKVIECANFDGTQRRVLIGELNHPFGLDIYGNSLYWTDWSSYNIERVNKNTGHNRTILGTNITDIMDVKVYHHNRKQIATPCHTDNGGCSHLCLLRPRNEHTCACPIGIILLEDKKTCANGPNNYLIVAHRVDIRQISLDVPYQVDVVLPFSGLKRVSSVDVDRKTGEIYWTDTTSDLIQRATIDGKHITTIVAHELESADAIAIDSTGRKIYWTDDGRNSIEVAELNGSNRKVLIWKDIDNPRAIVLHYYHGLLFWSDWGVKPCIEVAEMDGKNRQKIITTELKWPNGLAIDRPANRLYWTDGNLQKIESSNLDGSNRKVMLSDLKHPYGLVVVGNHIYWTDWQTEALHRADKNNVSDQSVVRDNLHGLMDLRSVQFDNIAENACGDDNGGCSHLCLRNAHSYSCACTTGIAMVKNSNKICEERPRDYLIIAGRTTMIRISLDTEELWDTTLPLHNITHAMDVDFHYEKNLLAYSDIDAHHIMVVNTNNYNEFAKIKTANTSLICGITIDWISDQIYWTDTPYKSISVAKIDGSSQRIILVDLLEPRSIAVFPRKGLLFWTEWGSYPRISRSYLDGSSAKSIVSTNLGLPNGLVLDFPNSRLYWSDSNLNILETTDLKGRARVQLVRSPSASDDLMHPFGLALHGDYVYWTDWYQKQLVRAEKVTGKDPTVVRNNFEGAMGVVAVSQHRQLGWNPCADFNGGCTHLCFYIVTNYTCQCPDIPDSTPCTLETKPIPIRNDAVRYEYEDDVDDETDITEYNSIDRWAPGKSGLTTTSYILILVPLLFIALLTIALFVGALVYRQRKNKLPYGTANGSGDRRGTANGTCCSTNSSRSVMTFANPNYFPPPSSGSGGQDQLATVKMPEGAVSMAHDKKPFLWKRLKYDKSHDCVYEEKMCGNGNPEVTSLIAGVMTPSSSNCEAITPEFERSPSVTPLHRADSIPLQTIA